MSNAKMYNANLHNAAGIPLTGRNIKYGNSVDQNGNVVMRSLLGANISYAKIKEALEWQDIKEFTQRYQWVNVKYGLNSELIERVAYFRGKGIGYYNSNVEKFQHLPFALNGRIDEYGRYTRCNSLPFTGTSLDNEGNSYVMREIEIVYDDLFDIDNIDDPNVQEAIRMEWESGTDKGIILNDSCLGLSQMPQVRATAVQPIISSMATCWQIINTAMFASADYNLIINPNESEYNSIMDQINSINERILNGRRYGVLNAKINMESMRTSNTANLQDLWETFNSLDNLRKATMGTANSGVFNKKERMLQSEQMLNGSNADDIYMDGLRQRQRYCELFNQYYGANMWVMSKRTPTENEMGHNVMGDSDDYGTSYYEGNTTGQTGLNAGGEM